MTNPETDPIQPASQEPKKPEPGRPSVAGLSTLLAIVAVLIAGLTWIKTTGEIRHLREEVATLALRGAGSNKQIDVERAPALGRADAVVTLVEFSDYECPYCIRHFQQTMPRIDANYVQTGKIRYVFRDFPIDQLHPEAIRAHQAARCALEQNKFWNLHAQLFSAPGTHSIEALNALAAQAGLDVSSFRTCLASGRTTSDIRATVSLAARLGADGTPAFFVGLRDPQTEKVQIVRALSGAQPYEQFAQALDEVLAEAKDR